MFVVIKSLIWLLIFIMEFFVIVIINVFILMVFVRNYCLCNCSIYLVMNLIVVDLLVGCFIGFVFLFNMIEESVIW